MRFGLLPALESAPSEIEAYEYDSDYESGRETNCKPLTGMSRYWPRLQHLKVQVLQLLRKHIWDEKTTETAPTTGECPYEATGEWQSSLHTVQIHETGYNYPGNKSSSEQDFEEGHNVGVRGQTVCIHIRIRSNRTIGGSSALTTSFTDGSE